MMMKDNAIYLFGGLQILFGDPISFEPNLEMYKLDFEKREWTVVPTGGKFSGRGIFSTTLIGNRF